MRGGDDFDIEAGPKGRHVGDDHLLVRWGAGRGEKLGELGEAKGCEDAGDTGKVVSGNLLKV